MFVKNTDADEHDETVPLARDETTSIEQKDNDNNNVIFRFSSNVNDIVEKHDTLLSDTKNYFWLVLSAGISFFFTYSARTNIIVLYAQTMKDDTFLISVFIYLSYVCSGIASLSFGIIGNKWRFDALLLIAAGMDIITFGLEATTNNFYVLMVCYAIGGQPFQTIAQAWNLKLLPTHYAKIFRARIAQYCAFSIVFGSVIGGVIAYLISYRATFYVTFIISIILFCFVVLFVFNKEHTLIEQQLAMMNYYQSADNRININISSNHINDSGDNTNVDYNCQISLSTVKMHKRENNKFNWLISDDFRFPRCLIELGKQQTTDRSSDATDLDNIGLRLSRYLAFIIGCFAITSAIINATESVVTVYFATYMIEIYNIHTAWSTSGIAVWSISLILSMQLGKRMIQNDVNRFANNGNYNNNKLGLSNKYIRIEFVTLTGLTLIYFTIFPLIKQFSIDLYGGDDINDGSLTLSQTAVIMTMYWSAFIASGVFFGISYVISEFITVEIMPKDVASTISGIKGMIRQFSKGVFCLIVGLLWNFNYDWMWYIAGIQCGTALLIVILVACIESAAWFDK